MILVTGTAGFIGNHLVKELVASKEEVIGIDIADMSGMGSMLTTFRTDITDDVEMQNISNCMIANNYKISACIHLAAVASPPIAQKNPKLAWSTNVHGTHNVLQLLHKIGCPKIVFLSSAHVYGISPKYMPTDENHPLALHDTYTTTKIAGEQLCRLFYENHGIAYTTLRLWNAYGPGQSQDYFLGAKIRQAKTGILTIRNEKVTKDWIHVRDVVRAILMALKSDYVGPLNVGTGIETSLDQIVGEISTSFGIPVTRENVPDEGPTHMQCDFRRIRSTLGWEPTIDFKTGLAELIKISK